jgi:hypothetical protein
MMVRAAPDQPLVAVHAVRQANGDLAVMLVNKDPVNSYPVSLHYVGYTLRRRRPCPGSSGHPAVLDGDRALDHIHGQSAAR